MNRHVIRALTSMTLLTISCSDDHSSEQLLDVTGHSAMRFEVSTEQMQTRAYNPVPMLTYIDEPADIESFYLVAQSGAAPYTYCEVYQGQNNDFIANVKEPLFWPNDSRQELDFYALSYTDYGGNFLVEPQMGTPVAIQNHCITLSSYEFDLQTRDVVAAYAHTRETKNGVVPLTFRHIFAQMSIEVNGENVPGAAYALQSINLQTPSQKQYDFSTNSWTDMGSIEPGSGIEYFYSWDGGLVLEERDDNYNTILTAIHQTPAAFIAPGQYVIVFSYSVKDQLGNETPLTKTATITLEQGTRNRFKFTLPNN